MLKKWDKVQVADKTDVYYGKVGVITNITKHNDKHIMVLFKFSFRVQCPLFGLYNRDELKKIKRN